MQYQSPHRQSGFHLTCALMGSLVLVVTSATTYGWENLLKDPGFETYKLDRRGFYVLEDDSPWREITLGRGSVQFDASTWTAPTEMTRERPLGFSPGTAEFKGTGPEENTGRIIIEQDVILPDRAADEVRYFEAWIWMAGGGNDNDTGPDRKEETAGMEVFFYDNTDTELWLEGDALEYHQVHKDFFGEPNTFVQVSGVGKLPAKAKGFRARVWATTWASADGPAAYDTEIAVDNAHFAIIGAPNMLINGDFELDDRAGEMKGWQQPADWPFPRSGMKPRDMRNTYGENFDHGVYRPFNGDDHTYGYTTYLDDWRKDAFTFSQTVEYNLPPGTPLVLTFHWIQNTGEPSKTSQLRLVGTYVDVVAEYLEGDRHIDADGFRAEWPLPTSSAAVGRYDQNANNPFNPRYRLEPPPGTDHISVHVCFTVNMPYHKDHCHVSAAVDDFWLMPTGPTEPR